MIGLPPRSTLFPYTPLFRSGFGGYPTVPPVVAAAMLGVPTIIHEQNGVMGRANRLLARWASMIATRSEEHTSELQSRQYLVCRLLLEKKKKNHTKSPQHIFE